jgi:hypothetical protein
MPALHLIRFAPYSRKKNWNVTTSHEYVLTGCALKSGLATSPWSTAKSSAAKKWRLSPDQISQLVWDSRSEEETTASSDITSEDEGGFEDEPGVSHLQLDCPTSNGQASSSSISTSASDGIQNVLGQQWTWLSGPQRGVVHTFTGCPRGKRNSEASDVNAVSCCILRKLWHCRGWRLTDTTMTTFTGLTRDLHPNLTWLRPKCVFLALTISIGHCMWDRLLVKGRQFPHSKAMLQDWYLHFLRFLHFTDEPDVKDENSDPRVYCTTNCNKV